MKIKLCIPSTDIKHLINALVKVQDFLENRDEAGYAGVSYSCGYVRNHIVEEGGYNFIFRLEKGFNHESLSLDPFGKLDIKIVTTPKE